MYKKILLSALTTITLLTFFSCEDWLELKPENYIVKQEFWKTKQQVHSAVIGLYASLLDGAFAERLFLWSEIRGDLIMDNTGCKSENLRILKGDIMPDNVVFDWKSIYKSINLCNTVIEYAKDAIETDATFTESEMNAYVAEALALRSMLYFYLVRSFGEVPLMLKAITSDQENFFVPKSPQDTIINQILNDLAIAEQSALTTYGSIDHDKGRITKYTINAIQADVYLWKDDFTNCIESCNKIIASNKFGLMPGNQWFQSIFLVGNSNESLFELQFSPEKPNPYYNFFHPTSGTKQFLASAVAMEMHDPDDLRGDGATFWSKDEGIIWKYLGLSDYERAMRSETGSYAHWIFYRYADVLLMKAEALNQQEKGTQAMELVRRIQNRANAIQLPVDDDDYLAIAEMILTERKKEFAYEGKRWFDVLRNAKRDNYLKKDIIFEMLEGYASADQIDLLKSKYSDTRSHYFPVYFKEIEVNPQLEQNSYYGF